MKVIGGFEDLGEAAHEAGQNIAGQAKQQVKNTAQTAAGQITGSQSLPNQTNPNVPASGTNEHSSAKQNNQMSDDQAKQFLKDLYGPSTPAQRQDSLMPSASDDKPKQQAQPQNIVAQAVGLTPADPNKGKTPEEVAKIAGLRNQLHADYYRSLTTPKPQEERAAEKIEREDQENEMEELQKAEEKPQSVVPPGTKQGTGETVVGVSG